MRDQVKFSIFHRRIGSGELFGKKISSRLELEIEHNHLKTFFFLGEESNQGRVARVLGWLLCTRPLCPRLGERISLHSRRWKTLRTLQNRAQGSSSANQGSLCCHLVAALRHGRLAAAVLFELGCGFSVVWLASSWSFVASCVDFFFFLFFTLYAPFYFCMLALYLICLQRL